MYGIFDKRGSIFARGLAALLIVLHHLAWRLEIDNILIQLLRCVGGCGTTIFLLLSGFGNQSSLLKKGEQEAGLWLKKRAVSLLLPFASCFAVGILFEMVVSIIFHIRFKPLWIRSYFGIWYFWVQMLLYLFLYAVHSCFNTRKMQCVSLILMSIAFMLVIKLVFHMPNYWYNTMPAFSLGVICASYSDDIPKVKNGFLFVDAMLLVIAFYIFLKNLLPSADLLFFFIWSCALIASRDKKLWGGGRFLERVGQNSYALFLGHWVILRIVFPDGVIGINQVVQVSVFVMLTIAITIVTVKVTEYVFRKQRGM